MAKTEELKITVDNSGFLAGMDEANKKVDEFKSRISEAGESSKGFSAHMLASRESIKTFSAITGASSQSLEHLVHAFEIAPGPIGALLAGLILIKEAFDAQREATEEAQKALEGHLRVLKQVREFQDNKKSSAKDNQLEAIAKDNAELRKKQLELQGSAAHSIFEKLKYNPMTTGLGVIGSKLTDYSDQIGEYQAALNRNKEAYKNLQKKPDAGDLSQKGPSHIQAVSAQELGVFRVEHDATQVSLLEQIVKNTAKIGTAPATNPASNFSTTGGL